MTEQTSSGNDFVSAHPRPLDGLRILDLSTYVAGPSGAMTLAQLGADVIRIDPPGGATDTRRLPLDRNGRSLYWAGLNKGKRSVEVDVSTVEGRKVVGDLLAASGDVGGIVLTNAVGQDWLGYEQLRRYRSDVIVVHILGRGDGEPAVDYTVNCEVGLPYLTGPVNFDRPVNHVLPVWDLLTGLHAAVAILSAERVRARTGVGGVVTVSLADVATATMAHLGFVADSVVNQRGRIRDGNYLYGSFGCDFATLDSRRVMVIALTERHWRKLVAITGTAETMSALERSLGVSLHDEATRYEFREVLASLLAPWFAAREYGDVKRELDASQVLWGTYRTVEELVVQPDSLLSTSEIFHQVDHPRIGAFPTPDSVLRFGSASEPPRPAPFLGEHTNDVLGGLLGLSEGQLAGLRQRGIIGGSAA